MSDQSGDTAPAQRGLRDLFQPEAMVFDASAHDKWDAIRQTGQALVAAGLVEPSYVDAMEEREKSMTTYIAEGVSIPHGTNEAKSAILKDGLAFVAFPDGVEWAPDQVTHVCVGIAAQGDGHVAVLGQLASVLLDESLASQFRNATSAEAVFHVLEQAAQKEDN